MPTQTDSAHPQRIYVDLDDVLCETGRVFVDLLAQEYGKSVAFESISSFDLGKSFGLSVAELEEFMRLAHQPHILGSARAVPGAREALSAWVSKGYNVDVVTGRPPLTRDLSIDWLERARMPYHGLIFVRKYARAFEEADDSESIELETLGTLGYSLAVEDSLETAIRLVDDLEMRVCLLDRPWNRSPPDAGSRANASLLRCRNWQQIAALFPSP